MIPSPVLYIKNSPFCNQGTLQAAILTLLVMLLSGCMQKVHVTYVPTEPALGQNRIITITAEKAKIKYSDVGVANVAERAFGSGSHLSEYFVQWEGVRYQYGGLSTNGVDCSGLTLRTYKDLYNFDLPRTVVGQSKRGVRIDKKSLHPGDLVFFKTGLYSRHVGVYLGKNTFIHASRSKGVTQSSFDNSYWLKKYWLAKRYPVVKS